MFNMSMVLVLTLLPIVTKSADFVTISWTQAVVLTAVGFVLFVVRVIKFTKEVDALIESDYANKNGARQSC